jgi:hypothetical protein
VSLLHNYRTVSLVVSKQQSAPQRQQLLPSVSNDCKFALFRNMYDRTTGHTKVYGMFDACSRASQHHKRQLSAGRRSSLMHCSSCDVCRLATKALATGCERFCCDCNFAEVLLHMQKEALQTQVTVREAMR